MSKILTVEDLYNFYAKRGRNTHFCAKGEDDEIIVSVRGAVRHYDTATDDAKEGLTPVHLQACHTLANDNKTFIGDDVMTDALPSFSNRPILAYLYKDEDGNWQFRKHDQHINTDNELIYDERPVGVMPESCNAHLAYDEEKGKTYVEVDGYIYDEYSFAKDILEREGECAVSIEIAVKELSYDAKQKLLVFHKICCMGVTILGRWEDGTPVQPGMAGSNIKIADFQRKNNAIFSNDNLLEMLAEMNSKLDQLTNTNSQRKEEPMMDNQNMDNTAIEPTEPVVENETTSVEPIAEPVVEPETEPITEPTEPTAEPIEPEATEPVAEPDSTEFVSEPENEPEAIPSATQFTKTFELAHDDVRRALYELLTAYERDNEDWCWIEKVYDNYFIYSSEKEQALYKQGYSKNEDAVAFEGDRVHINAEFVTDEELAILNEMRNNYAGLIEKLAQYESEPEKIELINSTDYAKIRETEEFVEAAKRENYFPLTLNELKTKFDNMLLEHAKKESAQFAAIEQPKKASFTAIPMTSHAKASGVKGRYGTMFVK